MKKKLLFILNESNFFISHRLPLAVTAHEMGYEIHVATPQATKETKEVSKHFIYHDIPLSRRGKNLFVELRSFSAIYQLLKRIKPDLVHLVTIKPVIYGTIAARLANLPTVVAAVPGLGYAFIHDHWQARVLRYLIGHLYRFAFRHKNLKIIFQNEDDRSILKKVGALKKNQSYLIQGSGVDLHQYAYHPEPKFSPPVVIMASRLLRQKGICEYIEAVKRLKARGVQARFLLAGRLDPGNPTAINESELQRWVKAGVIEYLGYRQDIPFLFSQVNLIVLPSYGEGLPRVLVEAAACGRATITTDAPGCRAAIIPGKTGLLIKPKDSLALAEAIHSLLENPLLRNAMGASGRQLAVKEFNIKKIIQEHLHVYGD